MIVLIWNFYYFCCWCRPCRIWRLHHPQLYLTNYHWHEFVSTACKTIPFYPSIPRNYSQYYFPHQYSNDPPLINDWFFLPIIKFHSNVNFNFNANFPNADSNADWHQNDYVHHFLSSTSYNHYFQYAIIYLRVKVISIVLWSFILLFITRWLGVRFVAGSLDWSVLLKAPNVRFRHIKLLFSTFFSTLKDWWRQKFALLIYFNSLSFSVYDLWNKLCPFLWIFFKPD